jgi:hypothetical protein
VLGTVVNDGDFNCVILYQGADVDPTKGDGYSFTTLFRRWRKARNMVILAVEIPKDKVKTLCLVIEEAGGKVISK